MEKSTYLFIGLGAIAFFVFFGIAKTSFSGWTDLKEYQANYENGDAKITIELVGEKETKSFSYATSTEKLFSQQATLNFSPAESGFHFDADNFKCEITCTKEE